MVGLGETRCRRWLVKIVLSIYKNAGSHVRVRGTFIDYFLVQVGLHQVSVLGPLLFIIVSGAI